MKAKLSFRDKLLIAHIQDVYWRYYFYPKYKKEYAWYMRLIVPFINVSQFPLDYKILRYLK
jgi:hypothetical protein